ncbi:MAG: UDP-2,3-diacylglucosamine diphosphatase [Bdellovibrionales bacterium]|nr:UDP-2,3-diacylglucosamine diphosphatase [Bdellovibrionales bacterium]
MRLFVLSDLHIEDDRDPTLAALIRFLDTEARPGDTVVLAGDIFDLFVGAKAVFLARYAGLLSGLRNAGERGVVLHYIEGNHDFHLRGALTAIPGLTLHDAEVPLELGGRRFYVAHGDLVDRKDTGYLALRLFFRSPLMKAFVAAAPSAWIERIGDFSRDRSKGRNARLSTQLPLDRLERLRLAYRNFACEKMREGYDHIILGHCHDLDEKAFIIDGRRGQYINMGYPKVHKSILAWEAGEERVSRVPFAAN